jgi:Oxidoreductase-like protein, N-terminal
MSESPQLPTPLQPDLDPKPQPPEPPDINDCCGNGCDPCIFDSHDMAMDAYRQALRAWQARHGDAPSQGA